MSPAPGAEIATIIRSYATIAESDAMIEAFDAISEANMPEIIQARNYPDLHRFDLLLVRRRKGQRQSMPALCGLG
jgi:hypothetical protein